MFGKRGKVVYIRIPHCQCPGATKVHLKQRSKVQAVDMGPTSLKPAGTSFFLVSKQVHPRGRGREPRL